MPIPREAQDRQLRFQLDSGREHPPHQKLDPGMLKSMIWYTGMFVRSINPVGDEYMVSIQ
eukprot:gene26448-biopygen16494